MKTAPRTFAESGATLHVEGPEKDTFRFNQRALDVACTASRTALQLAGLEPTPLEDWTITLKDEDCPNGSEGHPETIGNTDAPGKRIQIYTWEPLTLSHELTHAQDPRLTDPNHSLHYPSSLKPSPTYREVRATHRAISEVMTLKERARRIVKREPLTHEEVRELLNKQAYQRYLNHPLEKTAMHAESIYTLRKGPAELGWLI